MSSTKTKKKYSLQLKVNHETHKKQTDNLEEGIVWLKPDVVYTEMYLTAQAGEQVAERKLTLVQARKLFADKAFRQIFINNLLLQ